MQRVVLHVDMDAFYAAVEVRERPELAGKPLIIGHRGRRGVVSTCSYEARRFGVRSAMPSVTAARLCPQGIWLHGRMELYVAESRKIRHILSQFSPVIEPLSIDEAFIDLHGIAPDLAAGAETAAEVKRRIRDRRGLTASVGVAPNKFLAKLASDMDKPDGLTVLPLDRLEEKLWPLPVERLWGVGPRTAERLRGGGIERVGDLLQVDETVLQTLIGPAGTAHLRALARGEDQRRVRSRRAAKSISEERTYGEDLTNADDIDRALLARAEGVARQLRRQALVGQTVQLKVRTGDFTTWTRASKLRAPTDLAEPIVSAARKLFAERIRLGGKGVRLLGVGISGLDPAGGDQPDLFPDPDAERARRMTAAADAVRNRMGDKALVRARLLRKPGTDDDDDDPEEASSLPSVD